MKKIFNKIIIASAILFSFVQKVFAEWGITDPPSEREIQILKINQIIKSGFIICLIITIIFSGMYLLAKNKKDEVNQRRARRNIKLAIAFLLLAGLLLFIYYQMPIIENYFYGSTF